MLLQRLYSKVAGAGVALNAAHIAVALREIDRLHLVLEVVEVQPHILRDKRAGRQESVEGEETACC